ncbi:MAG: o-succinylbenzoate synthase [Thermoanaerobaculia bacterium]
MRVRRAVLRRVEMPLKFKFRTSFGETSVKKFLLLQVESEAAEGWGECVAEEEPLYSPETIGTARHVLAEFLIPLLFRLDVSDPSEFARRASPIRGNRMAKAAVECALWDLAARSSGLSLSAALGGVRESVDVGVSLGLQPSESALLELVARHVEQGYKRIKLKIEPGRDLEVVEPVRKRFPEIVLTADANAAYSLEDAPLLARLDEFHLDYLEQPLHHEDLREHAELARRLRTPICLDESIRSAADVRTAIALDAGKVVNIKIGRVGGIGEAKEIHDICAEAGIPVWCGGMLEAGVGRATNVHLATLPNFRKPGDTSSASRYFEEDIVEPSLEACAGKMPVPAGPGIGVNVRLEVLDGFTTAREVFEP